MCGSNSLIEAWIIWHRTVKWRYQLSAWGELFVCYGLFSEIAEHKYAEVFLYALPLYPLLNNTEPFFCALLLFSLIPPKTHLSCMGRGWLSLSEQWNIMILPTEKRQTISSDIWDLTTYFFLHEIIFSSNGLCSLQEVFSYEKFWRVKWSKESLLLVPAH